jgi:hypothetical protein
MTVTVTASVVALKRKLTGIGSDRLSVRLKKFMFAHDG